MRKLDQLEAMANRAIKPLKYKDRSTTRTKSKQKTALTTAKSLALFQVESLIGKRPSQAYDGDSGAPYSLVINPMSCLIEADVQ